MTNTPSRFQISTYLAPNPPNGKRVTRPSRWGNPFRVGADADTPADAVAMFQEHLKRHPELIALAQQELRGFDLGCTCALDQPCHADVWLQIANETSGNNDSTLSNSMPLTNTTERSLVGLHHQPDDDTPRVPDHLDDLATPQARRMQRLVDDLNAQPQTFSVANI